MPSTEAVPPGEQSSSAPRRFAASVQPKEIVPEEPVPPLRERVGDVVAAAHPTTRVVVIAAAATFVVGAITSLVFSAEAVPDESTITEAEQVIDERDSLNAQADRLETITAPRTAVNQARATAEQIVDLQTVAAMDTEAAAKASTASTPEAQETARQMSPYFSDVDESLLGPWYMAADDAEADKGPGFGLIGFNSAVTWQIDSASTIDENGRVPVRFSAYDSDSLGEGRTPQLLAWAVADYDPQESTMTDLTVGTTELGDARALKVGA